MGPTLPYNPTHTRSYMHPAHIHRAKSARAERKAGLDAKSRQLREELERREKKVAQERSAEQVRVLMQAHTQAVLLYIDWPVSAAAAAVGFCSGKPACIHCWDLLQARMPSPAPASTGS